MSSLSRARPTRRRYHHREVPFTNPSIDWGGFDRDGYVRLGRLVVGKDLRQLQDRIDSIMRGEADVDYDRLMMQLDSMSGEPGDLGEQTLGFKGPSTRVPQD